MLLLVKQVVEKPRTVLCQLTQTEIWEIFRVLELLLTELRAVQLAAERGPSCVIIYAASDVLILVDLSDIQVMLEKFGQDKTQAVVTRRKHQQMQIC